MYCYYYYVIGRRYWWTLSCYKYISIYILHARLHGKKIQERSRMSKVGQHIRLHIYEAIYVYKHTCGANLNSLRCIYICGRFKKRKSPHFINFPRRTKEEKIEWTVAGLSACYSGFQDDDFEFFLQFQAYTPSISSLVSNVEARVRPENA